MASWRNTRYLTFIFSDNSPLAIDLTFSGLVSVGGLRGFLICRG